MNDFGAKGTAKSNKKGGILVAKGKGTILTPGEKSPISAQGREVGPRGGNPSKTEVTIVKGKTVPPTSAPGRRIEIIDPTKHKK